MINLTKKTSKPKFFITGDKKIRLNARISSELSERIHQYQSFHKEMTGTDAAADSLISAFITAALTSDKDFQAWRKKKTLKDADSKFVPLQKKSCGFGNRFA